MRFVRRSLQIVALVGTLLVGIVALALIVSQTPWFRDWVRRYVVRESKQYLNGELTIGKLGGNLFFGIQLFDVAVDLSGERVVAVRNVEVDYSVFTLISKGVILDGIKLVQPELHLAREGEKWNVGRLVKEQQREAEREGPRRPLSLPSIEIADGSLTIDDGENGEGDGVRLPRRIDDLDVRAGFEYAPVHYSIGLQNVSFRATEPAFALHELKGGIAVRDDNLYIEQVQMKTDYTAGTFDGVVEQYLRTPVIKVTTTGHASLSEIGQFVPALWGYELNPAFDIKANGPTDRLALDLNIRSEAGNATGQVTANLKPNTLGVKGVVNFERLDLAPILKDRAQRSDISGRANVDLTFAPPSPDVPFFTRTNGTFEFVGPHAAALGYEGRSIRASGTLNKGSITLNARADAYGATATATGVIVPPASGRRLIVDLRGSVERVDLTNLPASLRIPKLRTNLSIADYHVKGEGPRVVATATLNQSIVEGATFAAGTAGTFDSTQRLLSYSAKGTVSNLNLVQIGHALQIDVLSQPQYDSEINGQFEVRASGTTLDTLTLDASGTMTDTTIMSARLPQMTFVTRIADRGLDVKAVGPFEHLNPARVTGNEKLNGQVSGSADASLRIANLNEPVTPETIEASGEITLGPSIVGAMQIASATVVGHYENLAGELTRLEVKGPDLTLTASGPLSLNRSSSSQVKYHVDATNLAEIGRLLGQPISGSAIAEGTLTGNATSLQTSGTISGNNLSYRGNEALDLNGTFDVQVPELTFADAKIGGDVAANLVKVAGVEINDAKAKVTYAGKTLDFSTTLKHETRELDAAGRVIFHPDHQELHLPRFAARTEGQEWTLAPGTEAAIQYGADKLTVLNLRLVNGDQALGADGALVLKGDDPSVTSLKVNATNVDLYRAEQLLLQERGLSGRLTAQAVIGGTASQPTVNGHVDIANGAFRNYAYQSLNADIGFRDNRFNLDARLQQSPTESFTAVGTVPMSLFQRSEAGHVAATAADQIDLRIASTDIGLGFIQGFTTALVNVTGTMQADIRVMGSGADPHVEGHVDIRNGAFAVPFGGGSYTGLDTRIELTPDVVYIKEFQLRDENGAPLTVSGQLAVHERKVGAVDVNLTSTDFEVIDNQLGDVGLGSKLKITGELRRPRVVGELRIERGRLELDQIVALFYDPYKVESTPDVVSAERVVEGAGSAREATQAALVKAEAGAIVPATGVEVDAPVATGNAFDPVSLDVHLIIPDNLVLRGRDLRPSGPRSAAVGNVNITVGGDLTVQKEPNTPIKVVGVVNTVRGTYQFQGRNFDLVRGGTIRFTGDLSPLLDVSARRVIPNTGVEARVHIKGSLEKPELELSSTPPLEESDILSLVIFNRPVNELGSGERTALAATAGGIATGFLAAPLGESIGRALDIDLFEITTTTESGELGAGVTIGQQIGDRTFFKLRQEFGDRNLSEFVIEYQIASFLRFQGSAAPETSGSANRIRERRIERAGMDLIFFFSY